MCPATPSPVKICSGARLNAAGVTGSAAGADYSGPISATWAQRARWRNYARPILDPDADGAPAYRGVTVTLKNGTTLRGVARNRTNYSLDMQDAQGNLHAVSMRDVAEMSLSKGSPMPKDFGKRLSLAGTRRRSSLSEPAEHASCGTEEEIGLKEANAQAHFILILLPACICLAQVRQEDILKGPGENWLTYAGDYRGQRHSTFEADHRRQRRIARAQVGLPRAQGQRVAHQSDRLRRCDVCDQHQ